MMNFISLGSGSSGNCYFLYTEDDGLMIDVGIDEGKIKKYFRDYGIPLTRIKHVLLTHDHADHVKSVGSLSHDFDLPVYSTQKVHAGIGNNKCVKEKVDSKLARFIEKDRTYTLGAFSITPFDVPHDSSDNVGYFITHEGVHFCLITDVGHVTDQIKEFIGKADYLVLEANYERERLYKGTYPQILKDRIDGPEGHLSNYDCGKSIAENATPSLRHVWLCHLSDENNHPVLAYKTVEQVLREHGIIAGKDFALEVLKRNEPSGVYELKKSGIAE